MTAYGKLCLQFDERHVSGMLDDPEDKIAFGLYSLRAAVASLPCRLRRLGVTRKSTPADGTRDLDTKAFRRSALRHSIIDGGNHTFPKVEREGVLSSRLAAFRQPPR